MSRRQAALEWFAAAISGLLLLSWARAGVDVLGAELVREGRVPPVTGHFLGALHAVVYAEPVAVVVSIAVTVCLTFAALLLMSCQVRP